MYRSAAEAGVRLPFSVSDLRKWALARRRKPKGTEEGGQFLEEPDVFLRRPSPRASTSRSGPNPGSALPDGDALDLPSGNGPASRTSPWTAVGHTKPEKVVKLEEKRDAAAKAAAKQAELAKRPGLSLAKNLSNTANTAAKNARLNLEAVQAARAEHVKRLAEGTGYKAPWVLEGLDKAVADAEIAVAEAEKQQKLANDARAKAEANPASARITNAAGRTAVAAAAEAKRQAAAALAAKQKATSLLNARDWPVPVKPKNPTDPPKMGPVPRPPFAKDISPAKLAVFQNPPPGYHIASPAELYERVGNSPMFSGLHIADDPNSYRPYVKFTPTGGKVYEYSPQYRYDQERKKWRRLERLSKVEPSLRAGLTKTINDPNATAYDMEHALASMIMLETGMRVGKDGNESFPKDENHPMYKQKKVPTYAATTLLKEHVTILKDAQGKPSGVRFQFMGKSGIWNDVSTDNVDLAEKMQRLLATRRKGEKLFPSTKSATIGKFLGPYGFDESDVDDSESSPVEGEADVEVEDATGKFKVKDLRMLRANLYAEEYFQRILDAKRRIPDDVEEFHQWLSAAAWAGSHDLGNEYDTFNANYLAVLPFMDVIEAMIEREKKKTRNRGPVAVEDYWPFGMKNLFPEGTAPAGPAGTTAPVVAAGGNGGTMIGEDGVIEEPDAEMKALIEQIREKPMPGMEELIDEHVTPRTWVQTPEEWDAEQAEWNAGGSAAVEAAAPLGPDDMRRRAAAGAAALFRRNAGR
jgi:DNA topoisomerase IB